jgi:hypothetical protein
LTLAMVSACADTQAKAAIAAANSCFFIHFSKKSPKGER